MAKSNTQDKQLFDDGVEAARRGDRVKAREVFTRLLRTEKENEEAWLWMSSVVDTDRERIYCLNTALKLKPDSKTALRGLALLGALPAELRPTPAYDFESDGDEQPAETPARQRRRRFRLRRSRRLEVALIVVLILSLAAVGFIFVGNRVAENLRVARITPSPTTTPTATNTLEPTATLTPTPEIRTATPVPTAAARVDASLAEVLGLERLPTATPFPPVLDNFYPIGDSELRAGIRAYEAGDYAGALDLLARAGEVNAEMPEAYYYRGLAYLALEDYLHAADEFNKAIDVRADFTPAYVGRGRANFGLGFDPLRHYEAALGIDPSWAEAYIHEAVYFNLTGQPQAAMDAINTGLQVAPAHVELRWRLAAQLLLAGQPEDALDTVDAALVHDPSAVEAYLVRGRVLNALARYADAQADLNIYTFVEPDDPRGWQAIAASFIGLGDPLTAVAHLTTALSLAPDSIELMLARGDANLAIPDYATAEEDFLAVEGLTNSVEARLGLGAAKMGQGLLDEARAEFARAVELAPDAFDPTFRWGLAEFAAGEHEAAIQLLTDAVNLADSSVHLAQARFERARVYAAAGRVNEAIADLRVVLTFNLPPSEDLLRQQVGDMLATLGGPLPGPTHTATPAPGVR